MVKRGDFPSLYAHFQSEVEKARREKGEDTAGQWRHFSKGSDPEVLYQTLQGKGTEWCTAGLDVARSQLGAGEFYIYYTYNKDQKPADPRVAIYLINGQISEVRGIYGKDQDLELNFVDVAHEKYQDFPGHQRYEKADHDMKQLSKIEDKTKNGAELTKEDLGFLYEMDAKIEGFGHGADPRVAELRNHRDPEKDMLVIFECTEAEIAHQPSQINADTKTYVGKLEPGIFDLTQEYAIEHIYTKFPEGRIQKNELAIGGKTAQELEQELETKGMEIYDHAREMLHSSDFTTLSDPESIQTVLLKVRDLGFIEPPTTDELYARAERLGLDLCPAEAGPHQRLQDTKQRSGEYYWIAMKAISDRSGYPLVFNVEHDDDGLWLNNYWAIPTYKWSLGRQLMFRLRNVSQES
jgi:hypothetical protein